MSLSFFCDKNLIPSEDDVSGFLIMQQQCGMM